MLIATNEPISARGRYAFAAILCAFILVSCAAMSSARAELQHLASRTAVGAKRVRHDPGPMHQRRVADGCHGSRLAPLRGLDRDDIRGRRRPQNPLALPLRMVPMPWLAPFLIQRTWLPLSSTFQQVLGVPS